MDLCDIQLAIKHGLVIQWLMYIQLLKGGKLPPFPIFMMLAAVPIGQEDGKGHLQSSNLYDSELRMGAFILNTLVITMLYQIASKY